MILLDWYCACLILLFCSLWFPINVIVAWLCLAYVKWTTIVFDNADTEIHILSFKDIQLYIVIYTLRETKLDCT